MVLCFIRSNFTAVQQECDFTRGYCRLELDTRGPQTVCPQYVRNNLAKFVAQDLNKPKTEKDRLVKQAIDEAAGLLLSNTNAPNHMFGATCVYDSKGNAHIALGHSVNPAATLNLNLVFNYDSAGLVRGSFKKADSFHEEVTSFQYLPRELQFENNPKTIPEKVDNSQVRAPVVDAGVAVKKHTFEAVDPAARWKSFTTSDISKRVVNSNSSAVAVKPVKEPETPFNETPIGGSFKIYLHNVKNLKMAMSSFLSKIDDDGKAILKYKKVENEKIISGESNTSAPPRIKGLFNYRPFTNKETLLSLGVEDNIMCASGVSFNVFAIFLRINPSHLK